MLLTRLLPQYGPYALQQHAGDGLGRCAILRRSEKQSETGTPDRRLAFSLLKPLLTPIPKLGIVRRLSLDIGLLRREKS